MTRKRKKFTFGFCICALVAALVFGGKAILIRYAAKNSSLDGLQAAENLTADIMTKKIIYISPFRKMVKLF